MSPVTATRRAEQASKVALFVLWAAFAAVAFNIYSEVGEIRLIDELLQVDESEEYSDELLTRIDVNDERQMRAAIGYVVAVGLGFIVVLVWVSRVNRACHALGQNMRFTPGWAWGYWLVPFLNLVRPFQIVRELWTTTALDGNRASPPLLGWWWATWLASGVISRYAGGARDGEVTLEEIQRLDYWMLAGHGLDIIAFGLTIVLVGRLTARLRAFNDQLSPPSAQVVSES